MLNHIYLCCRCSPLNTYFILYSTIDHSNLSYPAPQTFPSDNHRFDFQGETLIFGGAFILKYWFLINILESFIIGELYIRWTKNKFNRLCNPDILWHWAPALTGQVHRRLNPFENTCSNMNFCPQIHVIWVFREASSMITDVQDYKWNLICSSISNMCSPDTYEMLEWAYFLGVRWLFQSSWHCGCFYTKRTHKICFSLE